MGEHKAHIGGRHFAAVELDQTFGIVDAETLWTWMSNGASAPLAGNTRAIPVGADVVYRGQSDADFGLTSSLYRLCRDRLGRKVEETDIIAAETEIIATMRDQGIGRRMSDGHLLTVLQHHGIPTRLIDFSRGPLEALYFAVEGSDSVDGRFFIVHADRSTLTPTLGFQDDDRRLSWSGMARGTRTKSEWTSTAAIVEGQDNDPRMVAQRGVFMVGGLNRKYGGRAMDCLDQDGNRGEVSAEDFADVSSLGIRFLKKVSGGNSAWPARGWTVRIPAAWKLELRGRLAKVEDPITADRMYPPLGEVRRLAITVAQRALTSS